MVSGSTKWTQRRMQSGRRRGQQRMRVLTRRHEGCRVGGAVRVGAKVLEELLRGVEAFSAVGVTGDPAADVGPGTRGQGRGGRVPRQRRWRGHRAQGRERHEVVLLVVALGAAAGAGRRGRCRHHHLDVLYAVRASRAEGLLAHRHQGLSARGCLDPDVAEVGISSGSGRSSGSWVAQQRGRVVV